MIVKLVRHSFPDRPDWVLVEESVPLGTLYEVMGYSRDLVIVNEQLGEARPIEGYLLSRDDTMGWLPCVCFEHIPELSSTKESRVISKNVS